MEAWVVWGSADGEVYHSTKAAWAEEPFAATRVVETF
jgi:hypothetical protein